MEYKYFNKNELRCKCGICKSDGSEMDNLFMQNLEILREQANFPFVITSAYRCPQHNNAVSTTGLEGEHTKGMSVDIEVDAHQSYILLDKIFKQKFFNRIGIKRPSGEKGFIHIGYEKKGNKFPVEIIWTYR